MQGRRAKACDAPVDRLQTRPGVRRNRDFRIVLPIRCGGDRRPMSSSYHHRPDPA
jgi:hypothetical protein